MIAPSRTHFDNPQSGLPWRSRYHPPIKAFSVATDASSLMATLTAIDSASTRFPGVRVSNGGSERD